MFAVFKEMKVIKTSGREQEISGKFNILEMKKFDNWNQELSKQT